MAKNKITKMNSFGAPTTHLRSNSIEMPVLNTKEKLNVKINTKETLNEVLSTDKMNCIKPDKPKVANSKEALNYKPKINGNNNELTDDIITAIPAVSDNDKQIAVVANGANRGYSQTSNTSHSSAVSTVSKANCITVDLQGYVIIVAQTKDNKVKLYGSPSSDDDSLEVADEIMDVNDTILEDMTRPAVIHHIHECIKSCLITLRVKRRGEAAMLEDIENNIVQDAFLIAVEDKARERLQRLSALNRIKPVDMSLLAIEKNASANAIKEAENEKECSRENSKPEKDIEKDCNGFIAKPKEVTSISDDAIEINPTTTSPKTYHKTQPNSAPKIANGIPPGFHQTITEAIIETDPEKYERSHKKSDKVKVIETDNSDTNDVSEALSAAKEHLSNGCTEKLLGDAAAVLESNKLGPGEKGSRRRSGSSIVVLGADEEKRPPEDDALNMITMLSISSDNGPHREMAVDVPDSFIARNKTPPRYPPPRPPQVRQRGSKDEEPLLSSSGGSGTSFGSKQSTVLHRIDLSGPVSSDGSGSFKTQETSTLDLASGPRSSDGSRTSFGSKKSSKGSSETAKCGDLFSDRSGSAGSAVHTLNDHIIQLLISNGEDSLLDCREGVSYSAKTDSVLIREATYASYTLPAGFDTTPVLLGREVAVDVPDSFVQVVKTTPKYPSSVDRKSVTSQSANGTVGAKAGTPAVPPREAPRDAPPRPPNHEPTKEQLDSIKKYQEQIRRQKEAEDRAAAESDFLRTSLRGSAKLQALEASASPSTAFVNEAYDAEDYDDDVQASDSVPRPPSAFDLTDISRAIGPQDKLVPEETEAPWVTVDTWSQTDGLNPLTDFNAFSAAISRITAELGSSEPALAARLADSADLLQEPGLKTVLDTRVAVYNVQAGNAGVAPPFTNRASEKLKEVMDALGGSGHSSSRVEGSPVAAELLALLASLDMENLIYAHDQAAAFLDFECQGAGRPINHANQAGASGLTDETPDNESEIKIIRIEKTSEPLGATVRNEGDAVIIGRIVRGGAAEKSSLLHEGDELLEVNGVPMRGKSVHEVCQVLSTLSGTLTLWIAPRAPRVAGANAPPRTAPPQTRVLHVRAHFDYDPEDDVYIPCRELGISFQKGDVLHVIGREDPNWWQAFREGEEDQSLAGLIPSQAFQHQREAMKMTLAGEVAGREKARKGGTLLCAKKEKKKKKGKKATSEAGYPLYSTSGGEEYEPEEILTYEEVALYYPRASSKRPIVLIGPPNIGRHELRQRLMEDSSRFAAAVPHTSRPRKEHEMPGQDYHFISRTQFESDILHRKFVEHGEYEKAYYGTSVEAIREVVNSGKICVLNLHPQSLKILRGSDLKPYTVFVAPPSLEKLRQKKIRNNEAFKEDELKDIIATARDMEVRWGHLFDMIIINNDTQRAYQQLLNEINSLEREPQWVPALWLKQT